MDNTTPHKLGMKWYVFFTKVRPILALVGGLISLISFRSTFLPLLKINTFGVFFVFLNLLYILGYFGNVFLAIILLNRAEEKSANLLKLIKFILIYEPCHYFYGYFLTRYYSYEDILVTIGAILVVTVVYYFVWYRCNMKYFRRRLTHNAGNNRNNPQPPSMELQPNKEEIIEFSPEGFTTPNAAQKTSHTPTVSTSIPTVNTSKQRFCKYCGSAIDQESQKCTGCGKQYFKLPKPSPKMRFCKYCGGIIEHKSKKCSSCGKQFFKLPKFLIVFVILFLLLGVGAGGYIGFNYSKGVNAMNHQEFVVAQRCFDSIPMGDKLFPEKHAYIEAGVLMEEGKYIESLSAFSKLDSISVPVSITDSLKAKIYSNGQANYSAGKYRAAKNDFTAISGYKRSDDYLLLISCHIDGSAVPMRNLNKLVELIGFEDADDIILWYESTTKEFLKGRWETAVYNSSDYYFEIENGGRISYNLPHNRTKDSCAFTDGIYFVNTFSSSYYRGNEIFRFSIIDKDRIAVYCYKDGSTHMLFRTQPSKPEWQILYEQKLKEQYG